MRAGGGRGGGGEGSPIYRVGNSTTKNHSYFRSMCEGEL